MKGTSCATLRPGDLQRSELVNIARVSHLNARVRAPRFGGAERLSDARDYPSLDNGP